MDWQTPITILIVLGAGAYLANRFRRTFSGRGRAGGCGLCSASHTGAQIIPLVSLDTKLDEKRDDQ